MMKRTMLAVLFVVGCDHSHESPPTGKEEAGEVAIGCIEQMKECGEWSPVTMGDGKNPAPMEDCSEVDDTDYRSAHDCRRRNEKREERNWEIQSRPKMRSPCQQKLDSCVSMVEALVTEGPEEVHHHAAR